MSLLLGDILFHVPELTSRSPVVTEGWIKVSEVDVHVCGILFDSGALHKSFISEELVSKYKDSWDSGISKVNRAVRLGDNKTVKSVTEQVRLNLTVLDSELQEHSGDIDAYVWSMPGLDFIVGLPDIISSFKEVFVRMLDCEAVQSLQLLQETGLLGAIEEVSDFAPGELVQWSVGDEDGSPEEASTEVPCSFTEALNFMEVGHEESIAIYLKSFEKQVQKDFLDFPGVREFLESDMAKRRFAPKEWTGLKGFEPLALTFKPSLPDEHRVRSRSINPKLYEHARKEYDRLSQYMYRPSISPRASPLVIAPKATAPFIRFCGDYVWINEHIEFPQLYIPHVQHELEKAAGFKVFLDIDLTNSFHQIVLSDETSRELGCPDALGSSRAIFSSRRGLSCFWVPAALCHGHVWRLQRVEHSDFRQHSVASERLRGRTQEVQTVHRAL